MRLIEHCMSDRVRREFSLIESSHLYHRLRTACIEVVLGVIQQPIWFTHSSIYVEAAVYLSYYPCFIMSNGDTLIEDII